VRRRRLRLVAVALAALVMAAILVLALRGGGGAPGPAVVPTPPGTQREEAPFTDPFAWAPDRAAALTAAAAQGVGHALFQFTPGGVEATAARVAAWRPLVDVAAREAGVPAARLEALVFVESAGHQDAMAGGTADAVGLTQIVAETARNLLGMRVDETESARLTRRIVRERRRGHPGKVAALQAARRRVDPRYDPVQALAGTARYLVYARRQLGREDLALASYHMGIGNLQSVERAYGATGVSYAQLYFDSTPTNHPAAQKLLAGFGDDSANYLWKLDAAQAIMHAHRTDPAELHRLAILHGKKNSAEEVLHPSSTTRHFATPEALKAAWDAGEIRTFPDAPRSTGLRRDASMGELAGRLDVPAGLYRGLRPPALAFAVYLGAQVRAYSGGASPLVLTSTVRDDRYQALLVARNREATRNFSLHTTGYAFDVARIYRSNAQALAFQFVLDRMETLNVIAWVREPQAIHITVGDSASALEPLLARLP
jgi:hypothetical protein